jgi:hypothetical protein
MKHELFKYDKFLIIYGIIYAYFILFNLNKEIKSFIINMVLLNRLLQYNYKKLITICLIE